MTFTLATLDGLTLVAIIAATVLWRASDPDIVAHAHDDLEPSHLHLSDAEIGRHAHPSVFGSLHYRWPAHYAG